MVLNQRPTFVQFGCGLSAPPAWENFDASPTLRMQRIPGLGALIRRSDRYPVFPDNVRYGDIVAGLPVREGTCDAVYCSHVLEHLSLTDLRIALRNTYRYLRPGGVFRLVVPDLTKLCRDYLQSADEGAALDFMEQAHLGIRERQRGIPGLFRMWLGNSSHLWMWDFKSLSRELGAVGFSGIRRAEFGDAAETEFRDVEDEGRWTGCLGIHCVR